MPLEALAPFADRVSFVLKDPISMLCLDEVHFVDKSENVCFGGEFFEGFDDCIVGIKISKVLTATAVKLARFKVKNVDEDPNIGEDERFLRGEIIFRERILTERVVNQSST